MPQIQLTPAQRKVLFKIIRQIQVDTISNVLGIIDGTSGDLQETLTLNADDKEISGDLPDLFLEKESR